jgi:NAD+ synthase
MQKRIVNWIRQEVKKAGARGVVLGLSGGVDSSVVAALSVSAVGKNRVLGLLMPCHSQGQDRQDAVLVAKILGIRSKTIDLSGIYDTFIRALPRGNSLARANLKPRLRMSALYYFANTLNYLVCGTGNKSELMVGYFTKHGDGATDILPIAGLLKKEVRKLARELGIPSHIITKPPTAGLWSGQTDEGEMGLTYRELDDILERIEKKKPQAQAQAKVNKVKKMINLSEHKRQGPKICYI